MLYAPGLNSHFYDKERNKFYGTLACFARNKSSRTLGFITNQHVIDYVGNVLRFPEHTALPIALARKSIEDIYDHERFSFIDEPFAYFEIRRSFRRTLWAQSTKPILIHAFTMLIATTRDSQHVN